MEKYRYESATGWFVCNMCDFRCVAESLMKVHQEYWRKMEELVLQHKKSA